MLVQGLSLVYYTLLIHHWVQPGRTTDATLQRYILGFCSFTYQGPWTAGSKVASSVFRSSCHLFVTSL